MGLYKKIRGTLENIFQIGDGVQIKDNAGVLEARNAANSALAKIRAAMPSDADDVATKYYVETLNGFVIITEQADTSTAIPNNTGVVRNLVVTEPGNGAVIGDLLYDDGSGSGQMSIISAAARVIAVTKSLTGNTQTFDADSIYAWDVEGGAWVKIGDIGSVTGANRVLRYAITNAAQQDSAFELPANSIITDSRLIITTAYSASATIEIGKAGGSTSLIQDTTDNKPTKGGVPNIYEKVQDADWGAGAAAVRTTVGNTPAAGAGTVVVKFSAPLA